jgi:calcineurin-like phosphoesterase family protein
LRRAARNAARATVLTAALAAGFCGVAAAQQPPRIVAIGDVHGAYAELTALLQTAGLVDAALDWSGGTARLVLLGDVLDRGADSRRALELIIRLRAQAARAGGDAELVLGNHEVMNLVGDLGYVTAEELAAYREDEPAQEREAAWRRFRAAAGGDSAAAAQFEARYPPGFFGHRALFAPDGRFGSWLLSRPVLATIDRTAFVHGGLSAAVAGKTALEINREYNDALRDYVAALRVLKDAGALHAEDSFGEHAALAARFVMAQGAAATDAVRRAAEAVASLGRSAVFGGDAVYWYRGTAACSAAIERARLDRELAVLGVDRVVIGHTPTPEARVLTRFDATVIRADTGMLTAVYRGRPSAVVIRGAEVRAVYAGSSEETAPLPQPRAVGPRVAGLDDDGLERWLATARVVARKPGTDGAELLELDRDGALAAAVFRPSSARRGLATLPEVAAYRLDRLLELDLVPVTVRREIDGRVGSLQLDVRDLPSERQRASQGAADARCPLRDQFDAMYAFDVLGYGDSRSADAIRYTDGLQLVLADNARLFAATTTMPPHLRNAEIRVPNYLAAKLAALSAESLAQTLGDVLDERQRGAILARRDLLLGR